MEDNQPSYGIITTSDGRDKIAVGNLNPFDTPIREIMTRPVEFAKDQWTLQKCSVQMLSHQINHMPVCDETDTPIGMISATDIFLAVEECGWGTRVD